MYLYELAEFCFLIYVNDLPKIINKFCTLFADDTSLLIPCKNNLNINTCLHETISNIIEWLQEHNLKLNFTKTKIIQFKPYQKAPLNRNFSYKNNKLECVTTYPLLGVNIDSNLTWKHHTSIITTKISKFTYALYELKKATDLKTATSAYYAYAIRHYLMGK